MGNIRLFIRLSRPIFIIGGALLYALGAGIAHYLGVGINWNNYILGQLWVTLLQLSTIYLNEFYNATADESNNNRTLLSGGSGALGPGKLNRRVALMAAFTCLAVLASLTVILISQQALNLVAVLFMFFAFMGSFFYSTPPFRLEGSGYGELLASIIVAFMVSAFAFVLQMTELHRLVVMTAFPITLMHLAMLLALELPDYFVDLKYNKRTVMVRIGWQNGMILHNILILSTYLTLGFAAFFGLPSFVWLPAFLTLPLGLFQMWQLRQISLGGNPNWSMLTIGALSLFGLMVYLMTYAYWTH